MAPMTDDFPDTQAGEVALGVAKALVSIVPILGGPAAELMDVVLRPRVEERRTEWLNSLAEHLAALSEDVDGLTIESLADDPVFISAMLQASTIAIRNHEDEKLDALRNAVLNVAIHSTPEEDEVALFITFIDTFTPWHLRILAFLADKRGTAERRGSAPFPNWTMGGVSTVLDHTYPELAGRRSLYDLVVADLNRSGLITISDLHATGTADGYMFAKQSSPMGDRFLAFIEEPTP